MVDPMTAFTCWGWPAPFLAEPPQFGWRARVVAVRSKTGLVAGRRGGIAHLDDGVAAVFEGGRARFGARFLCGGRSPDVAVLPDASVYGQICVRCEDVAAGPCVYRCFDAPGTLLYIGSTVCPLKRMQIHKTRTPWWPEVADVQLTRYPTIFEARAAERLAIIAESPLRNRLPKKRDAA